MSDAQSEGQAQEPGGEPAGTNVDVDVTTGDAPAGGQSEPAPSGGSDDAGSGDADGGDD